MATGAINCCLRTASKVKYEPEFELRDRVTTRSLRTASEVKSEPGFDLRVQEKGSRLAITW